MQIWNQISNSCSHWWLSSFLFFKFLPSSSSFCCPFIILHATPHCDPMNNRITRWFCFEYWIREAVKWKKTETVWFFTKQGGGEVPPNQTISVFFKEFFYCFKMIYLLWNMKITHTFFSPIMTPSPLSPTYDTLLLLCPWNIIIIYTLLANCCVHER